MKYGMESKKEFRGQSHFLSKQLPVSGRNWKAAVKRNLVGRYGLFKASTSIQKFSGPQGIFIEMGTTPTRSRIQ